ncbi:hypothetical protein [Mucilaginibacter lappiensis]|uniref:Uncharacterized protein n=1 Tax=Mucilaginibacter lappiensis TaxID=354630 RepID=A0A1N6WW18_9SPHI|nr:hypothetical protein [Mucilaginibacter lappiensis]MBB6109466.1 hypothetical protein [Mucilaginibacter lappiensis]MBB6127704.1 hypothetical protein [Mucilaginibacter lappiensis]SIQ94206.1 hypothetical protein SAMN05421821_104121 [Mucilaginibacter lappiensis]
MNSYLRPGTNPGNNKGVGSTYLNTYSGTVQNERYIEKYGPHRGDFKVFHIDGSFADLPDQHVEGGGANAGATTK